MNMTVGHLDEPMEKGKNGGTLGNFMADAFLTQARLNYKKQVDVAFMNYGGIRLLEYPAGKITRGGIFELMPFDNSLILIKAKGEVLQQFLDLISNWGGWPCAGMTMQVKDRKAVNVMIGGKPINNEQVYTIAISDFIANGGDNAAMLKNLPRENNYYLVRDALMDYVSSFEKQGKPVFVNHEIRVTNVK
jgi:2',3'-cyclic-nucleotide 2'-phosphodiesterase (5'-nucleotidase family)